MTHKNEEKKIINLIFRRSFEGGRLLPQLRRFLWRPRDKQIAIFDQKKINFIFSCIFFFHYLS
jgi:hypothetical protein